MILKALISQTNKKMQIDRTLTLLSQPAGKASHSGLAALFCLLTGSPVEFRSNFS